MRQRWYVESYAQDGTSPEGNQEYESYEMAFEVVRIILGAGMTARFLAPAGAPQAQIDSFIQLGHVQRI